MISETKPEDSFRLRLFYIGRFGTLIRLERNENGEDIPVKLLSQKTSQMKVSMSRRIHIKNS